MGMLLSRVLSSWGKTEARIVMVGLDAAGKTTILYKLQLGERVTTIPTIGFNVEKVEYKNLEFTVWDVGGQNNIRKLWKHYYKGANGIIFVVDSNDRSTDRVKEARDELKQLLDDEELKGVPLLVFANKQDMSQALSPAEIAESLDVNNIRSRKWHVQGASATNGDGLYEGLDFLANAVREWQQSNH
eukprot:TRINITY_DN1413_c0_g1_i2.p1 TRINITY_DN1413_c0_g1~~TRINITY_DN1413_c0_g1_i2.p1  ORF type:complete len:187 (-),score=44.68 TRINITY_DN1413_c0_g1_i2:16-576(-)